MFPVRIRQTYRSYKIAMLNAVIIRFSRLQPLATTDTILDMTLNFRHTGLNIIVNIRREII
jgi:hypothetical protein